MKYLLALACLAALAGCNDRAQPVVHGQAETPPAAPQTSKATEDLIAQKVDAAAKGDKPLAKALDKAQGDQERAELTGSVRPLAALGILLLAVAAFLAVEGASKLAMGVGAAGVALMFGPLVFTGLAAHIQLITWTAVLALVVALCFHIRVNGKKLRAHAEAVKHLVSGGAVHDANAVSAEAHSVIHHAWTVTMTDARRLWERLRHFGHAAESKGAALVGTMTFPATTTTTSNSPVPPAPRV